MFIVKSKEDVMKKLLKLAIAGILVATSLSACIVVPAGPPHGGYYRHGPYYGGGGYYGGR